MLVGALVQKAEVTQALGVAELSLSPGVGPPTTATTVRGKGFSAGETVDLRFDGTPLRKTHAGGAGRFASRVVVPGSALPGDHTIQATGESGGEVAEATFTVRTDWPQFHFDNASTGYNPYENVLGPANVSGLQLSWTLDTGANITGSPAVVAGTGYVAGYTSPGSDTKVLAFDAATGVVRWHRTFANGIGGTDPIVWGGTVYVSSPLSHAMFALDALTGETLWVYSTSGNLSAAVISGGILYTASSAAQVFALDARTGQQVWASGTLGTFFGGLAISDGRIYIGSHEELMYALDQATGAVIWSAPTPMALDSVPAVAEGRVFIGCLNGSVIAFDAATGAQLWRYSTRDPVQAGPAVWQGTVYVGTEGDGLYAFSAADGRPVWHVSTLGSMVKASPVVANGVVYVGTKDDSVYAFDALTGDQLWSYQTGFLIGSSPAVADGVLYFGSFDDNVYSFRLP